MSKILDRLKQAQVSRGEDRDGNGARAPIPSPFESDRFAPPPDLPGPFHNDPIARRDQPPLALEIVDEIAQLFARLRPLLEERGSLILHVASANPGEGASTVASALACYAAATRRHRTLLIDANPAHAADMNGVPAPGLVESHLALREIAASVNIVEPESPGTVALAGPATYAAGLPDYAEIERIYTGLRPHWPLIIIDAAPVLHSIDILNIAPLADGVLLVVEAEHSRQAVVQRAKDQLDSIGAHLIGAVLNRRRFHIPPFLYRLI